MTNEIKEILDNIKTVIDEGHYRATCDIDYEDCKILLDYITNLQEENERKDRLITQYAEGMCAYANRIDKAIEYINKYEYEKYCPGPYEKDKYIMREEKEGQDLLNILRGDE